MTVRIEAGSEPCLADRIGVSVHVSPLRMKLHRLQREFPAVDAPYLEDWLVDVANARGARIVVRPVSSAVDFTPPDLNQLSNEELVIGLCLLQDRDRPPLLRLAAQLISQKAVAFAPLKLITLRERVGIILAELARQALKVDPQHDLWKTIAYAFANAQRPREPILHWSRIAEPAGNGRLCRNDKWRLIA